MAVQVVVALAVVLAGIGFLLLAMTAIRRRATGRTGPSGRRIIRSRAPSEPGPPPPTVAAPVPDTPEVQVNRRIFLNRAWLLAMSVFGVAFGGTSVAMLWPNTSAGFGGKVNAGKLSDILKTIDLDGRYYNPTGRFYIVRYAHADDENNQYVKAGVTKEGIMTLYQKCAHLGCRVPFCPTSEWFECPCHGSQYNYAGERRAGPAPAGLWRFPFDISDGQVVVDTSAPTAQPPLGTDTINQPPAGPHCISQAEGAE
ncbi:MAG: ubiquinol-cytochrome c reductase iron-sulfur subunit [Actinomycetota bacterium]